ncbi:hypothetical protein SEA_MORGANA_130 [Gordonia phage Morgana]|uniref:Uncharacterized protein n=1 Tax=Gordonia phage Morgana TaxID=3137292 RepID=A0AAX4RAX9_9CAUD
MSAKSLITKLATTTFALGAAVAVSAAPANAWTDTDYGDNVRLMFCAPGTVDIDYTNVYGNSTKESGVTLRNSDGTTCRFYDFTERSEYGGSPMAMVTDDNGGYVECGIWVNGIKTAEAVDDTDYHSLAACL